jgi:hypothetical protein
VEVRVFSTAPVNGGLYTSMCPPRMGYAARKSDRFAGTIQI